MRKFGIVMCGWLAIAGLWANPALAQKKSVAEELLDIMRAENRISEEKYRELMNRAKAENEAREAGVEAFRRDSVKDVRKGIEWLDRISFFGDMRFRVEGFYQDHGPGANARTRERIRLRFGTRIRISDELEGTLRLASGTANDPISTNQSLDNLFNRKPINLDQAFLTITPGATFGLQDWPWRPITIYAGKMSNTLWKPRAGMVSEMIFDDDLTPEGTAETLTLYQATEGPLRRVQLNAIQWLARESSRAAEAFVWGGQVVTNFSLLPVLGGTVGVGDYYFSHESLFAKERNTNSDLKVTNGVILRDGTIVKGGASFTPNANNPIVDFESGFNIFNASLQLDYNTGYPQWPLNVFVDYAHNFEAAGSGDDEAVWVGAGLGVLRNPGDLAFSLVWARVETESLMSMFTYSDFGRDGGTNVQGPFIRVDYLLFPRLTITAKNHFVSFIDRPQGQSNSLVNRFQLDAQLAF
jgi:hypothetical protein